MGRIGGGLSARGGGGGSIKLRVPTDVFVGANRGAAEAARDAGLNAAALAEFNADPNLAIILRIAAADTFQVRRTGAWRDVTHIVEGARGPGPTAGQVAAAVQAAVKTFARIGGPVVPDSEIDPDIARDSELPDAGTRLPDYSQVEIRALLSRAGALFWRALNLVPTGPETQSGIGHVLTIFGTGPNDYRWSEPQGGEGGGGGGEGGSTDIPNDSIVPAKIKAGTDAERKAWRALFGSARIFLVNEALPAIAAYNAGDVAIIGRGGVSTVAFHEIDDPRTELTDTAAGDVIMLLSGGWTRIGNFFSGGIAAQAAQDAADAAQLATDTRIKVGPPFRTNERTQRNLYVSLRHPLNAYNTATLIKVSVQGSAPVLLAYDPNTLHAQYVIGLQTAAVQNIANAGHLALGNFVDVAVELLTGRDGDVVFYRVVSVPVEAAIPTRFERDVGASGAAGNVPAGTTDLEIRADVGTAAENRGMTRRMLLSNIPALARVFIMRARNGDYIAVRMAYTAATRTLTYSVESGAPQHTNLENIKAIGWAT